MALPRVPVQVPQDPMYACELPGCGKIATAADTHSIAVVYRKPGPNVASFQCAATQHYGCCADHAVLAALLCLVTHILPAHEAILAEMGIDLPVANRALLEKHLLALLAERGGSHEG